RHRGGRALVSGTRPGAQPGSGILDGPGPSTVPTVATNKQASEPAGHRALPKIGATGDVLPPTSRAARAVGLSRRRDRTHPYLPVEPLQPTGLSQYAGLSQLYEQ